MTIERSFRLSLCITLILSVLCLGYAEWEYLPEVTYCSLVVSLLILIAYRFDSLDRHISLAQANLIGALIVCGAVAWLTSHYVDSNSLMNILPWPAGGLPFLAPLLMLVIPAKLFRTKEMADWWTLYGVSLACVVLAIALAEDGGFVVVALLYCISVIWSLTHFYYFRVGRIRTRGPRKELRASMAYFLIAAVVAVPVFFLTPRTSGLSWELFNTKLETGITAGQEPDMARTGTLKPSREVAFEVTATKTLDGPAMNDLPRDQRFRVAAFNLYESPRGRWQRGDSYPIAASADAWFWEPTEVREEPKLGPDSFVLRYSLGSRMSVFADPVAWKPNQRSPISMPQRNYFVYARQLWDASFAFTSGDFRMSRGYVQVTQPENDRSPTNRFPLSMDERDILLRPFLAPPPSRIRDLARQLLADWRRDGRISSRMLADGSVPPESYDAVAEEFRRYLAANSRYRYSLDLKRQDRAVDPMVDFLFNVRNGHCERFASAMVLLCRGVGIPAQLVIGYRGCEPLGEGRFRVRQSDAHAWAEVLMPFESEWYWKSIDATPVGESEENASTADIIAARTRAGQQFVADLVIKLNQDTQQQISENITDFAKKKWPLAAMIIGGTVIAFVLFRVLRRRSKSKPVDPCPLLTEWSRTMARVNLERAPSETVRDFANRTELWLRQRPELREFHDMSHRIAHWIEAKHYAVVEPKASETELRERLSALAAALRIT